jgi:RimJ/RimL family protein N-acetyltransferase
MTDEHELPIVYLHGQSVYLRPLEMADLKRCQRWINDPATRSTLATFMPTSEIAEREFIENAARNKDGVVFAIVLAESHRHIGTCGLMGIRWKDRAAEFGILIGETGCRGKGYGTEATELTVRFAFETLNLNRVQLGVFDFNEAGIRAYEKVGFVREGVLRESHFIDGRFVPQVVYSLLASEYFARKG